MLSMHTVIAEISLLDQNRSGLTTVQCVS